jgi:UDP-N-acetylmuramoyl-tripeptide--D-alanyl-D-alanine ligase
VAAAAGATLLDSAGEPPRSGPRRVVIDSREVSGGELFVGLRGERADGGEYAAAALRAGAWGVLVTPEHAASAAASAAGAQVLAHAAPLAGLQALAAAWRGELRAHGTRVIAITGSTGKTSTKDILAALLAPHLPTAATPANLNTEIGVPLAILAAPADTRCLVLELAMRGPGQIAELTAIADPDVGVLVNVGPAHLELLGSLEAIAAAKAELIAGLAPGRCAVMPAGEPLLEPHVRSDVRTISFGEHGDVSFAARHDDGRVSIRHGADTIELTPSFGQAHNLLNLLAAVAAARAVGVTPGGPLEVEFSPRRGTRVLLASGVVVIDDCYNANPMSMRAALDELADSASGRRVAVLGDMLELGPEAPSLHREIGAHAAARGVEVLVCVGPLAGAFAEAFPGESHVVDDAAAAAELLPELLRDGDTVLLKGSRGVGLERVLSALVGDEPRRLGADAAPALAPGARPGRR